MQHLSRWKVGARVVATALYAFVALCGVGARAFAAPTLDELMADFAFSKEDVQRVRNGELVNTSTKETSDRELAAVMVFLVKVPVQKLVASLKSGPSSSNDPQVQSVTEIKADGTFAAPKSVVLQPGGDKETQRYLNAAPGDTLNLSAAEIATFAALKASGLYANNTAARLLGQKAKAVLVFPSIVKAGFMFGGQMGDGVLMKNGRAIGYYNSLAASYGLQAGVQVFGYALFFMNDGALSYLDKSDGWELGVGPSIVVVDAGVGKSLTSTTITQDVYAFIFDQKGLMAGLGIQGSKITKIEK